jgi:hypothetical protein
VEYTVASYDPATETYTINSLEKVAQNKLEGVLRQTVAESAKTLPSETSPSEAYLGKQVRYKNVAYTVTSFHEETTTYTISSVVKVKKDSLEDQKTEASTRAGGQGKRAGTWGKRLE